MLCAFGFAEHCNTVVMYHRLLGPSHRDVLQLTSNLREASQVLFTNPDVRLMPPDPDEFIEVQVGIFLFMA